MLIALQTRVDFRSPSNTEELERKGSENLGKLRAETFSSVIWLRVFQIFVAWFVVHVIVLNLTLYRILP